MLGFAPSSDLFPVLQVKEFLLFLFPWSRFLLPSLAAVVVPVAVTVLYPVVLGIRLGCFLEVCFVLGTLYKVCWLGGWTLFTVTLSYGEPDFIKFSLKLLIKYSRNVSNNYPVSCHCLV